MTNVTASDGIRKKVLESKPMGTWVYRREIWDIGNGDPSMEMESAYALDGSYIGNADEGRFFQKKGIVPQRRSPELTVASVGWNAKKDCWEGWSHRARSHFPTFKEASDFAESVASDNRERSAMKSKLMNLMLGKKAETAAEEDDEGPAEINPREWNTAASQARAILKIVTRSMDDESISGGLTFTSNPKFRTPHKDADTAFIYVIGKSDGVFPFISLDTSVINRLRTMLGRVKGPNLGGNRGTWVSNGLYVKPLNSTRVEIGIAFSWDSGYDAGPED